MNAESAERSESDLTALDPDLITVDEAKLQTQEERDRHTLDAMLQSRKQRRAVRTIRVHVESLDAEFVLRGLDECEFEDIAGMRDDVAAGKFGVVHAAAKILSYALVSPRMDANFLQSLGVLTVEDAILKTLLPGEVLRLSERVSDLSGMSDRSVEDVKN